MSFTEERVNGQYFRRFDSLNSDGTRHYKSYSFKTDASDVLFNDGTNAQDRLSSIASASDIDNINTEISALKKSVSDGKTTVANAITGQGVTTATDATFATIADNVMTLAANRYNAGIVYADGRINTGSASYEAGYDSGINDGKHYFIKYVITHNCLNDEDNGIIYSAYGHEDNIGFLYHLSTENDDDGNSVPSGWFNEVFFDLRDIATDLTAAGIDYSKLTSDNIYFVTTKSYYGRSNYANISYTSPIISCVASNNNYDPGIYNSNYLGGYLIILA